jgi:hypothetical protein
VLGRNCEDLLAVSDRGNWLQAKVALRGRQARRHRGRGHGAHPRQQGPEAEEQVLGRCGGRHALTNGRIAVGFESRVRFGTYDIAGRGLDARFQPLPHPKDIDRGPENGEIEALGELPDGRLIAIAERQEDDQGNIRGWAWKGRRSGTSPLNATTPTR